jgi:tetratricopeptide (TPR) repeat protein
MKRGRPWRRCVHACVFLGLIRLLPATWAAPEEVLSDEGWASVRTPKFHILTSGNAALAGELARELELFRTVVGDFLGIDTENLPPVTVMIFRHPREMDPFRPYENDDPSPVSGFFARGSWHQIIALSEHREHTRRIVLHEATHWVTQRSPVPLPPWLSEGSAEFFSTFRRQGDRYTLGEPPRDYSRSVRRLQLMPTEALVELERGQLLYRERHRAAQFYAQSWLLTHYLWRHLRSEGVERFHEFVRHIAEQADVGPAFEQTFGRTYEEMDQELRRYQRLVRFHTTTRRLPRHWVPVPVEVRPATPVELARARGELLLGTDRHADAAPWLRRALEVEPDHAQTNELLGAALYLQQQREESFPWFERALELGSDRSDTRLIVGNHLLRRARQSQRWEQGQDYLRRSADLFHQVIETQPARLIAYHGLAIVATALEAVTERDRDALLQGRSLAPDDRRINLGLAAIWARLGKTETARHQLNVALDSFPATLAAAAPPTETWEWCEHNQHRRVATRARELAVAAEEVVPLAHRSNATDHDLPARIIEAQQLEAALQAAEVGELELARTHLSAVAEEAASEPMRERGEKWLKDLEACE